jgi:hypothetical protein
MSVETGCRPGLLGHWALVTAKKLPQGAPVRVSVSPETVRLAVVPGPANCWVSELVLQNLGEPATEIRIRWEVYQP